VDFDLLESVGEGNGLLDVVEDLDLLERVGDAARDWVGDGSGLFEGEIEDERVGDGEDPGTGNGLGI